MQPAERAQALDVGAMLTSYLEYIDRSERTEKNALANLRQFVAWLRYAGITRPQRGDVIRFRDWLSADHEQIRLTPEGWTPTGARLTCQPSTVRQYLQSVKQFFAWADTAGLYPDIARNIHAPKVPAVHRKDALEPEEIQDIERHILADYEARARQAREEGRRIIADRTEEQGKRLYAIFLLAINAGLRTVELSRANVRDLESKGGKSWLYVWGKGHSGADQRRPIAPEVKAAIDSYLAARRGRAAGSAPLFVSTGNRSGGQRIAPTTISAMIKQAMQSAGYDSARLSAHSLRHTTGQQVMRLTGGNIYTTQQYMRHADPRTTEIYLDNEKAAQEDTLAADLYRATHTRKKKRF